MNHWNYDYWILVLFNYSLAADLTQLEDGAERDFGWLSQMMKNHRLSVQKTLSHFRVIPASRSSRLPESAYESSDLPLKTEQSKIIIAYWLNFEDTRLSFIATRWPAKRGRMSPSGFFGYSFEHNLLSHYVCFHFGFGHISYLHLISKKNTYFRPKARPRWAPLHRLLPMPIVFN